MYFEVQLRLRGRALFATYTMTFLQIFALVGGTSICDAGGRQMDNRYSIVVVLFLWARKIRNHLA